MTINPYIFRGYDIRGVVDKDLNVESVEIIGKAYGTWLVKNGIKTAVVGSDCRLTSDDYREAIIRGLTSTGIDVFDLGMSLVQIVYYGQYHFNTKGAVMVSASHNPAEYNGFKLGADFSQTMVTDQIQEVRKLAEEGEFATGKGTVKKEDITEAYFAKLLEKIKIDKKFRILADFNNATAAKFLPRLMEKIGAELVVRNSEIDGSFPNGTPDPTERHLAERLAKAVLEEKADIGLTFDADGDRLGVVDDKGAVIWNDMLVAIFAADVLENNPGEKIIYNALCSKVVEETIRANGGKPIMWLTGHSWIKEKLFEEKAPFAGELSGHFFFVDKFYGHDDGFYAALRLLEYLSRRDKPFSEVIKEFPVYISSPEIKIGCPDEVKAEVVDRMVKEMKEKYKGEKISDIDGIRVDFSDAMFIVRYSQNGPYLSPKFEAKTQERYEEMKKIVVGLLKDAPEIDWSFGANLDSLN
ncbi:MAG: phosphomannomutase/phosphoglucomutase [bacterium]|nr:phosphomannomutase/phosphoglucomutase [bacterium]